MMRVLCLLLGIILSFELVGQTCCSGGVPLSANIGFPAAKKGSIQASLVHDLNILKTLKDGHETLEDRLRLRRTNSVILSFGFTMTNRFSIDFSSSYVWQIRESSQPGLPVNTEKTNGFGDLILLPKFLVSHPDNQNQTIMAGLGVKFPTGKTDISSSDGIPYILDLQPGSGAFDGIFWALFNRSLNIRRSAAINALFVMRKTGTFHEYREIQTYEIGDNFRIHLGLADQLVLSSTVVNASLNLKYRKAFKDQIDQQPLQNTGGDWLFISPDLRVNLSQNLTLSLQIEIPIYTNVNGEQLSTTSRSTNGVYLNLPPQSRPI